MLGVAEVQLMIELGSDDCARMRGPMWKYCDLPMDLADTALVRGRSVSATSGRSWLTGGILKFTGLIGSAAAESWLNRGHGRPFLPIDLTYDNVLYHT